MEHEKNIGVGENVFWTYFSGCSFTTCSAAVKMWYDEIHDYDFATTKPKDSTKAIGHFTQVVWESSVAIGVGIAYGVNGDGDVDVYIVGRYSPGGNMQYVSAYQANVHPLKSGAVLPASASTLSSNTYAEHCGACKDGNTQCPGLAKYCNNSPSIGAICKLSRGKC